MLLKKVQESECGELLQFIRDIAEYEKLSHEVVATVDILRNSLFGATPRAQAFFIQPEDERIGFAVLYFSFSTFSGRPQLYIEDIFISPEHRAKGYGSKVWEEIEALARSEGCSAMHWNVLDWNQPAINFYLKIGAKPMSDWTMYRKRLA